MFNDKEKWCPHCKAMKPLEDFGNDVHAPSGRDCYCKIHRREYSSKYYPKRVHYVRMTRYGLNRTEYESMLKVQGGKCAVCLLKKKLCVDHDHKTKKVRGLLCSRCNIMVAYFEKVQVFNRVRKYLST